MDELLNAGRKVKYRKGEILIRPSDVGGELFILVNGLVHSYTIEESGEKNIHLIYGTGEIFPLAWIIKKKPLSVYYEALSDCEIVKVSADKAVELMHANADTSFTMLTKVIEQFVAYKARVDNLEYKFARERVAYRLLLLGKRFGKVNGDVITLPRFSQEEIGSATNVSRESVNREMSRFEKLGYIKYSPGELQILSQDGLHKEIAPIDSPLFIDDM